MSESLIHLRVPAATKGRWIRASRAEGMRLTDWIINAVEAQMQQQVAATITIPEGLRFEQLQLTRTPAGAIKFDWRPIEALCAASGVDVAILRRGDEGDLAGLIVAWYHAARASGEAADVTAEDLIAEVAAEDRIGQTVSLPPGRA